MERESVIPKLIKSISDEKRQHPYWPKHVVASAGIVSKEAGILLEHSLESKYGDVSDKTALRAQALRTASAALLFLENLK